MRSEHHRLVLPYSNWRQTVAVYPSRCICWRSSLFVCISAIQRSTNCSAEPKKPCLSRCIFTKVTRNTKQQINIILIALPSTFGHRNVAFLVMYFHRNQLGHLIKQILLKVPIKHTNSRVSDSPSVNPTFGRIFCTLNAHRSSH